MSSERDSFAKGIFSTFAKGFLLHKLLLKVNFSPLRIKNPAHMTWANVHMIRPYVLVAKNAEILYLFCERIVELFSEYMGSFFY
jgi:hypothetical protein